MTNVKAFEKAINDRDAEIARLNQVLEAQNNEHIVSCDIIESLRKEIRRLQFCLESQQWRGGMRNAADNFVGTVQTMEADIKVLLDEIKNLKAEIARLNEEIESLKQANDAQNNKHNVSCDIINKLLKEIKAMSQDSMYSLFRAFSASLKQPVDLDELAEEIYGYVRKTILDVLDLDENPNFTKQFKKKIKSILEVHLEKKNSD